jgi:phosphatidate cytidylyltransferase
MNVFADVQIRYLFGGILAFLTAATLIGLALKNRHHDEKSRMTLDNMLTRIKAWWIICAVFIGALSGGEIGILALFGGVSFFAFREFISVTSTKNGDHRTLWAIFFIIIPLQYCLIGMRRYDLFSTVIPVYAFIVLPIVTTLSGEHQQYLGRIAKIQWGMMTCVYCVSAAPAILSLEVSGYQGHNVKMLLFLILLVELSDVFQDVWGKCAGKRKILPTISPNKTWEGFLGGTLTASALGTALWWVTPFQPIQAFAISLGITLIGFGGNIIMSAIKRDLGIKDYGSFIPGHGGILDKIGSLCFAAPVFFHITRYFFVVRV